MGFLAENDALPHNVALSGASGSNWLSQNDSLPHNAFATDAAVRLGQQQQQQDQQVQQSFQAERDQLQQLQQSKGINNNPALLDLQAKLASGQISNADFTKQFQAMQNNPAQYKATFGNFVKALPSNAFNMGKGATIDAGKAVRAVGRPIVDTASGQGGKLVHDTAQLSSDVSGGAVNQFTKAAVNTPAAVIREAQNKPITDIQKNVFGTTDQGDIAKKIIGSTLGTAAMFVGGGVGKAAIKAGGAAEKALPAFVKSAGMLGAAGAVGNAGSTEVTNPKASLKQVAISGAEGFGAGVGAAGVGLVAGKAIEAAKAGIGKDQAVNDLIKNTKANKLTNGVEPSVKPPTVEPDVAAKTGLRQSEAGSIPIGNLQDMIDKHAKITKATGDVSRDFSVTKGTETSIKEDVAKSLKSSPKLTPGDKQLIQDYRDAKLTGHTPPELPAHLQAEDAKITALNAAAQKADAAKARLTGDEAKAQAIEARDPSTYTHLETQGKGSNLEYNLRGDSHNPLSVGGLGKTTSSSKAKVYHAITDEEGNRSIVAIKNTILKDESGRKLAKGKQVTQLSEGGKTSTPLGRLNLKNNQDFLDKELSPYWTKVKNLQKEYDTLSKVKTKGGVSDARITALARKVSLLEDPGNMSTLTKAEVKSLRDAKLKLQELTKVKAPGTNATSRLQTINQHLIEMNNAIGEVHDRYNPETLNKKVFVGKDGKKYTISPAGQSEITKATGQRYFVDPTTAAHLNYASSVVALEHTRFIENTKSVLEDRGLATQAGETAPKGYVRTTNPYFQGYKLQPKLAAELDAITGSSRNDLEILNKSGRFLRQTIVYFPLRHVLNEVIGFFVDRADKWLSPLGYVRGAKAFTTALKAVATKNDLYEKYLKSGTTMMSADDSGLEKAVKAQIKGHLNNKQLLAARAKALGMSPKTLYNAIQHVSVWDLQDILNIARTEERRMPTLFHPKGRSFEDALAKTERYNFQYKIPAQVGPGKIGRSVANTLKSDKLFFAPYTYDKYRIITNILKDTAHVNHPRDAVEAAAKLAAVTVIGTAVWSEVNKGLQAVTGDKNAHMTAPGIASVPELVNKARQGKATTAQVTGQLSLAGPYSLGAHLVTNSDTFSPGGKVSDPNAPLATRAKQTSNYLLKQLSPVQKYSSAQKNTAKNKTLGTVLGLAGASIPKNSPESNKLQSLRSDSLPIIQSEAKAAAASGDIQSAQNIIRQYNQKVLQAAQADAKSKGQPMPSVQSLIKGKFYYAPKKSTIQSWTKVKNPVKGAYQP